MKITAQQLFTKLVDDYKLIGQSGSIQFTLKDLSIRVETKDTIGNLIQEWLKEWMRKESIDFEENLNTQTFPDIYLDKDNKETGLLEIKVFNYEGSPGFDLANFESYCNSLLENAHRLDSDYLILAYEMTGAKITIKNIWLKKIWEISSPSGPFPIKVQAKENMIYNLRPATWYSDKTKYKPFATKEEFLKALNETRYQYPKTHHDNAHWLRSVVKNYKARTGSDLTVN